MNIRPLTIAAIGKPLGRLNHFYIDVANEWTLLTMVGYPNVIAVSSQVHPIVALKAGVAKDLQ